MVTVKGFKADVSSVSPSSVALSAGIFAVSLQTMIPNYFLQPLTLQTVAQCIQYYYLTKHRCCYKKVSNFCSCCNRAARALFLVPVFSFYHILTSSVTCYWKDARQHGIYLIYRTQTKFCPLIIRIGLWTDSIHCDNTPPPHPFFWVSGNVLKEHDIKKMKERGGQHLLSLGSPHVMNYGLSVFINNFYAI